MDLTSQKNEAEQKCADESAIWRYVVWHICTDVSVGYYACILKSIWVNREQKGKLRMGKERVGLKICPNAW